MTEDTPLVSVIIPTRNSADTIEACLRSIRGQSYSNLEIIVVDNYSHDRTVKVAWEYGAKVYLKGPERGAQVNFGVSKAKGKYVYRVDSDFVLEPNVVSEAVQTCEKNGYDGIAVHNTSDPNISFWAKVRKMERDSYRDDNVNVAARFWKREVFETVGGFDVELVAGDDYDLQNRLLRNACKIGRISSQETHIGEPRSMAEIFRKHYYYGQKIAIFIRKNQERALIQLSPIRPSLLRTLSKSSNEPTLIVGFIVYQFLRYTAACLGMMSSKLKSS